MTTATSIRFLLLALGGLLLFGARPASADDIEVEGAIEALGESTLTVGGYTFLVTEATEFDDDLNDFSDLEIGLFVSVEGFYAEDGTLIAEEIEAEEEGGDDGDDNEVEVEGLITELTDDGLTVGGFFFLVTETTEIENDDAEIAFEDLELGTFAEVEGFIDGAGDLIAEEIDVEGDDDGDDDGDDSDLEVEGTIDDLGASSLTVGSYTFFVTEGTEIEGEDDEDLTFADLQVGQYVEVEGFYGDDGTLFASEIDVEDFGDDDIEVEGAIESLGDASLTVLGLTFVVTDDTIIEGDDDEPILFSDLAVGLIVEVHGADVDGTLVATRIEVEDDFNDDEVELKAALDSGGEAQIVVLGRAFRVLPTTPVLGFDDEPIVLSDLEGGDVVEVAARRDADGTLIALRIERDDDSANEIELEAAVTAVSAASVDVIGISFVVDEATVIVRDDDEPATLDDLAPGQRVDVDAVAEESGVRRATRIQIEDDGQAAGRVGTTGNGTFDLLSLQVTYDGTVPFVDEAGAPFEPSALQSGQTVRVSGSPGGQGTLVASRIVVLGARSTTASEGGAAPSGFAIESVYPNPISDQATIRYTLDSSARVAFTVIDVLGRRVQRVTNVPQSEGTHSLTLDASALPSGLYFVTLDVEGAGRAVQKVVVTR
jgi:hypothetical protein